VAKISPFAPKRSPKLPAIDGVRMAACAAGIRYPGRKDLLLALRLHTVDLPLFQGYLLGAYLHFGLLHVLVFLMYLDRQREMLRILLLFCALSGLGTWVGVEQSSAPHLVWSLGYVLAGGVCLMVAIRRVLHLTDRFDYELLFRQELRDADQRVVRHQSVQSLAP